MEHVWIMKTDGIVLFHKGSDTDEKINCDLIAGFISAMNVLASQMDERGLSEIEFGQGMMSIAKVHDVLFIIQHDKHVKHKKIASRLDQMASVFFSLYPPQMLSTWRGNLSLFSPLNEAIAVI